MKRAKKFLSLLLCAVMVLGLVPFTAQAKSATYTVNIITGDGLEITSGSGEQVVSGIDIEPVTIEAKSGYHLMADYIETVKNQLGSSGLTLTEKDAGFIISGMPTVDVYCTLSAALTGSSTPAYATKEDLLTRYDLDGGTIKTVQKVYFGYAGDGGSTKTPQVWKIAGKDAKAQGDNLVLFANSNMKEEPQQQFLEINNPLSAFKDYTKDDNDTITYDPIKGDPRRVRINHYGKSDLRSVLKTMATDEEYFTTAQQTLMIETMITTKDVYQNNGNYTTRDVLYAAYGYSDPDDYKTNPDCQYVTVGINEDSQGDLNNGLKISREIKSQIYNKGKETNWPSLFWLRAPDDAKNSNALTGTKDFVGTGVVNTGAGVVPAFNLNLTDVLFASTAPAATRSLTSSMDIAGNTMTFRWADGTGPDERIKSTALWSPKGVSVTNQDGDKDVFLCVQGKYSDTGKDWIWAKKVSGDVGDKTIFLADAIQQGADLSNCKIWLETTDDGLTYAKQSAEGYTVNITANANSGLVITSNNATQIVNKTESIDDIKFNVKNTHYLADVAAFINDINAKLNPPSGLTAAHAANGTGFTIYGTPTRDVAITLPAATQKLNPSALIPKNLEGINGQTLADVELPNDWSWADSTTALAVNTTNYTAVLNTKNYEVRYDFSSLKSGYDSSAHTWTVSVPVIVHSDEADPTGAITVKENSWGQDKSWNSQESNISFDIFSKDKYTVTIEGDDADSGVAKIEYLLSDTAISDLSAAQLEWKTYPDEGFELTQNGKYIIYAKITDNSNNVAYISSQGMVIDKSAPVLTGAENGKTYCSAVEITVTDTNLKVVTVDGTVVDVKNNKFTVSPKNGTQEIVATDKAGNETTRSITVKDGHTWGAAQYAWNGTQGCTATHTCAVDGNHTETAQATTITKAVTKKATCKEMGETTYTAVFTEEWAQSKPAQTKTIADIPITEHSYAGGECTVCGETDSKFKPSITAGANGTWYKGSKTGLSITSDAAIAHFQKVQVDGQDIDKANYEVMAGSTVVTLKAAYLESLPEGKHTVSIVSVTGAAETSFTVAEKTDGNKPDQDGNGNSSGQNGNKPNANGGTTGGQNQGNKGDKGNQGNTNSPKTGDNSHTALWIALMVVSLVGVGGAVWYSRKKKAAK